MALRQKLFGFVLFTLFLAAGVSAGTLQGTVRNGTTGKIAAGVKVILIQLQGGMQPVANTQSNAQGEFTFDNPGIGAQPMLVRAVYHDINFHQPVPPGKASVTVDVFEISKDAKSITVPDHVVIFQPSGNALLVGEEYAVQNHSTPPQAYFKTDGNFEFALPEGAKLENISASGPSGMPVVQAPIDKTKNHFSIAYAFRPGENAVRYRYQLDYPGNSASVKIPTVYPNGQLLIVAPPSVQISADGLQAKGQEQGMNLYGLTSAAAGTAVAISVSGTAPSPEENPQQGRDAQAGGEAAASGINVQQAPGRLDQMKWPIVAGFLLLFGVFAVLLARKPVVITTTAASREDGLPAPVSKPATTALPAVSASMAEVDSAVGSSLDALKEKIFKLELRRQAGTISDADYAQERSRVEALLRDLVRG